MEQASGSKELDRTLVSLLCALFITASLDLWLA